MATALKTKPEEDFSFLPDQNDTSFLPDQHPAPTVGNDKPDDFSFLPDKSGEAAAPPQPQAGVTDQPTPPANPFVRPTSSGGADVTDEGLLHAQDTTVLGHLKSMIKAGLPAPLQPIVDVAQAGADKLKETYDAATGATPLENTATPSDGEKPVPGEDTSFLPDQQKKDARDGLINAITPGLDPLTGALVQTERGKRSAMALVSGMAGTAAGMVASVPAAESFFGKDTIVGQKAQAAAKALQKIASDTMPENPDFGDQLASGAGSMALFMVPGGAAGRLVSAVPRMGMLATRLAPAIGAGISAVLQSATNAGGVYEDQLNKGLDRENASKSAFRDFWQNAILIGATNKLGIFGDEANLLKKALMSAPLEGIQFGAQSVIASLAKNEPIDWKGDVLPNAGVGMVLGAAAGPIMEGAMGEAARAPRETTTITDETLGTNGSAYLKTKFPQLYEQINNQTAPVDKAKLKDILVQSAAAGEEVILKGGSPEDANKAAVAAFAQTISPHVEEAHAEAQAQAAKAPVTPKAPTESIEDLIAKFDPSHDEVSKNNVEPDATVLEHGEPTEAETSHIIPIPDNPIRIRKADIEAEAQYLHQRALEERDGKVSPLEQFVKENGGISTYRNDPDTGKPAELEEYKNIPVRLRGGTSYDEMRQMAMDHGVLPHDAPYSALYDELGSLQERGGIPKVEDFYQEARHNIEYEKLQDRAAKGQAIPPDIAANYSAQRVDDLRVRAKAAADKILTSNKINDRVMVDLVDAINVDPEAFKKGYGEEANPAQYDFKGETKTVPGDRMQAVINLAHGATEETGRHEAFHAVSNILLDEAENKIITNKYGDMEKAADAFGEYRGGKSTTDSVVDKIFGKVKAFLEKLSNYFNESKFTTADELFQGIEHGRFADRALRDQTRSAYDESQKGVMPQYTADETAELQKRAQYSAMAALKQIFTRTESVRPQINAPEFKDWFGDSKVVDKNGAPAVVYHGTTNLFSQFDPARRELGFHFGASPELSEGRIDARDEMDQIPGTRPDWKDGASIMPVYLKLDNPVRAKFDVGDWSNVEDVKGVIKGALPEEQMAGIKTIGDLRTALQEAGFDGITYKNQFENYTGMKDAARESYIAFEPEQIKSAYNMGSFDPNNADIRYSAKEKPDPRQYDLFDEKGEATIQSKQRDPFVAPVEKKAEPIEVPEQKDKTEKEMADVGDQLWYNRRNFTDKGLEWDKVKDMNPTLKVREVTKPKVWAKPDYEDLVSGGMNPFTAHLVKQVYDSIAIKPDVRGEVTDTHMKDYIASVNKVKTAVFEWARNREAQAGQINDMLKTVSTSLHGGDIGGLMREATKKGGSLVDKIFPPREGQAPGRRFYENKDYNAEAILLGGNRFVRSLSPGYSEGARAMKAIKLGWPASQEAWVRQYAVRSDPAGTKVYDNGQYRVLTEPEFYVVKNSTRRILQTGFKSQEAAEQFARGLGQKKKPGETEPEEALTDVTRKGPIRREEGENVDPQRLMDNYGFRGVNYGNWVTKEERQDFTNKAHDALADLSDFLDVPQKSLSLNGMLGLAFGAQGRGGSVAAHFIAGVNEINLTKTKGAGSLAHEWAHALDHYFAVKVNDQTAKSKEPFLTHNVNNVKASDVKGLRPEILDAFKEIVDTMKHRTETSAEVKARVEASDKKDSDRLESWITSLRKKLEKEAAPETKEAALKDFDTNADRIRKGDLGDGYVMHSRTDGFPPVIANVREVFQQATGHVLDMDQSKGLSANATHARFKLDTANQERRHAPQRQETAYLKAAENMDSGKGGKPYWSSETELFARAFHSYVLDGLADKAQRSDYLVRPQPAAGERGSARYPQNEERTKIKNAFDKLIGALKTEESPKGVAMYSATPNAPVFYSTLEGTLEKKLPERVSPEVVHNILNGQDIRKEEAEWSGLKEWLADKKGMVSKKDVMDFVRQNQIQIKEVMLGQQKQLSEAEVSERIGLGLRGKLTPAQKARYLELNSKELGLPTKFSQYTLPDGRKYKELLLTLPTETKPNISLDYFKESAMGKRIAAEGKDVNAEYKRFLEQEPGAHAPANVFKSSHYSEDNILAHVRFNERTDDAGRKMLFLEEVQSDWHQKGRDKGYEKEHNGEEVAALEKAVADSRSTLNDELKKVGYLGFDDSARARAAILQEPETWHRIWDVADKSALVAAGNKYIKATQDYAPVSQREKGVPDAPFKKTWHELALKRMLRYAAENGFDRMGWTTGEQQAERYDLSKQVSEIRATVHPVGDTVGIHVRGKDGETVLSQTVPKSGVSNIIGKDMAEKVLAQQPGEEGSYKGLDLKVGGEGMKGFYDQIIPNFLDKYAKKWGAKSEWSTLQLGPDPEKFRLAEYDGDSAKIGAALGGPEKVHALDITPDMRKSVMELGQPQYSAEIKPSYEAKKKEEPGFYEENRALRRSSYQGLKDDFRNVVRDLKKGTDKILGTISTRLKNIDPSLRRALRWYEFRTANRTMEDLKAVEPFIKKVMKMESGDRMDFDLARKNGDMDRISSVMAKYNMGSEYYGARKVLNDIYKRSKDVGFDLGYLENYFPRKLKDSQGFLDYVSKRDDWSILQDAISAKETALQRYLTVEEKAELINSMIRGTRRGLVSLSETGNMKDRVIEKVTPQMNQFYYDSDAALVRYVNEVNAAIENRRFFGKGAKEKSGSNFGEAAGSIDVNDSIGAYMLDLLNRGVIKPSQEKEVRDMLAARFAPTGPGPIMGLYRNIGYIDAMGSPISALSQLGDIGFSTYRGGFIRTGWQLAKSMVGKSEVKRADIGIEKIAQEFSDPVRSYKLLEKVFKGIGLDYLDALGKETYINTVLGKFRSQLKNPNRDFFERLTTVFGPETPQIIKDLESGKITENVKYLLFSELSDVQPISLAEMPEKYLSGGNGRILYMLKSFAIKQIDLFRNEAFQKIQQPGAANKVEGIRRLVYLAGTLGLANAGADLLKNILLNRPTDISDMIVDNMVRLTGISKYAIYDARRNGLWDAAMKTILPPHKALDALYKDFANVDFTKPGDFIDNRNPKNQKMQGNWWMGKKLESPSSIPYLGKFYYWWFGKGADLSEKTRQKMRQQAALHK